MHTQYTCYRSDIVLLLNANMKKRERGRGRRKKKKEEKNSIERSPAVEPHLYFRSLALSRVIAKLNQRVCSLHAVKLTSRNNARRILITIGKFPTAWERSLFSSSLRPFFFFSLSLPLIFSVSPPRRSGPAFVRASFQGNACKT